MRDGVERRTLTFICLVLSILLVSSPSFGIAQDQSFTESQSTHRDDVAESPVVEWEIRSDSYRSATERRWSEYADESGYVKVIVSLRNEGDSSVSGKNIRELIRTAGLTSLTPELASQLVAGITRDFSLALNGFAASIPSDSVDELGALAEVAGVFPDYEVKANLNDSVYQIGADHVWEYRDSDQRLVRGYGVVVAIIDTGVDYTHPDLGGGIGSGYKVIGGYDFYNDDPDPIDDNGHGTHVAGIVTASGGVTGVAPDASILAYKVLGAGGSGSVSDVIAAIEAAMDPNGDGDTGDHADVISMSLGGDGSANDPCCVAVREAVEAGIVVVVAAGNSGPGFGSVSSPGIAPEAITVGALYGNNSLAEFSSRGVDQSSYIKPEISAPGVEIVSTVPFSDAELSSPSGYMPLSGTSMATPHVSGAVALMLQMHPEWSPAEVKSALLSGSQVLDEPLWHAGAGGLWAPSAVESTLFVSDPLPVFDVLLGVGGSIVVTNKGPDSEFTVNTADRRSVLYNGSKSDIAWMNISSPDPSSISVPSHECQSVNITMSTTQPGLPEGYWEGTVLIWNARTVLRVPFGFSVLSRLDIHVKNMAGSEVRDPYGGVLVYSLPSADVAIFTFNEEMPVPPATMLVPSGNYSVHALGHQYLYSSSDPYVLSCEVSVGVLKNVPVVLRMSDARKMTIDLTTQANHPIYVRNFLMYVRHPEINRVSLHVSGDDWEKKGGDLFSLPTSRTVYISPTSAYVGISIVGFSYSPDMWDFISMNWDHWYEYQQSASTDFAIESSADQLYLLSWEYDSVDASSTDSLGLDLDIASIFVDKYDIAGEIPEAVSGLGGHLSMGASSYPYLRRGASIPVSPFFSGMTRTTFVQGVFGEHYWPASPSGGQTERAYYALDYDHLIPSTVEGIYLPSRDSLTPIAGIRANGSVGAGPFYPSVRTDNTNDSLVLLHPLIRDQSGNRVSSYNMPRMYLSRTNGTPTSFSLIEYLEEPEPIRVVPLLAGDTYTVGISFAATDQICSGTNIGLRFTIPDADVNPPYVTSFEMPQRFVPGQVVDVVVGAADDCSVSTVEMSWKEGSSSTWFDLPIGLAEDGRYVTGIQTAMTDGTIDLMLRVSDPSGNYLEYAAANVSIMQVPVSFEISAGSQNIPYIDGDVAVLLEGHLTDLDGSPLHETAAVPLELKLDDRKVGMILDEYVEAGSHEHNGTIRFEWHFNPSHLFARADETRSITVNFDLGIYEPVSRTLTLHSMKVGNSAPTIYLASPANGSMIPAGEIIDLSIWDDGVCTVDACLDGSYFGELSSPWDIDTSVWTEGTHLLEIVAADDEGAVSTAAFAFDVDAFAPLVTIIYPTNGSHMPSKSKVTADVFDTHLSGVWYSADGLPAVALNAPYEIDISSWVTGEHTVVIWATDIVGHVTSQSVSFAIVRGSVAIGIVSPADWSVIRSSVPIVLSIVGNGTITTRWSESGVWYVLGSDFTISTLAWSENRHEILINATNDLGESDELQMVITIDDTSPVIVLESPGNNSFVDTADEIRLRAVDANLKAVAYTIWNHTESSALDVVTISLSSSPGDGYFEVGVSSSDKAGNEGRAMFRFAMDSHPPTLSVEGLESGSAIKPGYVLNVIAYDLFLSSVKWSLDVGVETILPSPFAIDTSLFSSGSHDLSLVASDASGKQSNLNLSLYVDSTPPTAQIVSSASYAANSSLEIVAKVTDDYRVSAVVLHFELQIGGYGTMSMLLNGTAYVALLTPDLLWNGMTVYVVADDTVGNAAESPHITLSVKAAPGDSTGPTPGDDGEDGPSKDRSVSWLWFGTQYGLLTLGFIVAASVLTSVLIVGRRRASDEEASDELPAFGPMHETLRVAAPRVEPAMCAPSVPVRSVSSAAPRGAQPAPAAGARPTTETRRKTLIDAIPKIVKPVGIPMADPEDAIDYGELIERELDLSAFKNSVFRSEIRDEDIERELESLFGGPQIMSGLMLKKLMDLDTSKM